MVWNRASAAPGCPRASFSDGKAILSCASKGQPNRALGLGCADLPANLVLFFLIAGLATLDLCVDFRATGLGGWVIAETVASGSSALLGTSVWSLFKRIGLQGATAPAKVDGRETAPPLGERICCATADPLVPLAAGHSFPYPTVNRGKPQRDHCHPKGMFRERFFVQKQKAQHDCTDRDQKRHQQ
jgi:hypothetical protein